MLATQESRRFSRRMLGRSLAGAALGASVWPREAFGQSPARRVAAGTDLELIKLSSNENSHGPGPAALEAIRASLGSANRYPYDLTARLRSALAASHEVGEDHVMVAPGSSEILRVVTRRFTSASKALVMAAPTFEAPSRTAQLSRAPIEAVPVQPSGSLDLPAMAAAAARAGLFFVCNPNNPTGGVSSAEAVSELVARVRRVTRDAVILVDEAYFEYVEDDAYASAIPLTRTDRHVIVSRTFSKIHGMAGLRVGYAIGHPDTLTAAARHLAANALSGVSASAALASLGDTAHIARQRTLNREARAFTRTAWEDAGYHVLPSETNFLMVDVQRDAASFRAMCRDAGVGVARPFPPLTTYARISIGTLDEMRQAMKRILPLLSTPTSARSEVDAWVSEWRGEC